MHFQVIVDVLHCITPRRLNKNVSFSKCVQLIFDKSSFYPSLLSILLMSVFYVHNPLEYAARALSTRHVILDVFQVCVCVLVSVWSTNKCHHRLLYSHKVFATASTNCRAVFTIFDLSDCTLKFLIAYYSILKTISTHNVCIYLDKILLSVHLFLSFYLVISDVISSI